MYSSPNELYTVFSFIGFVLSVIPLYWHLEACNMGTCLYMVWTGLGCLMQSINSIVWNKNMINRVPVYCDISTRIQVALNVAIPSCSLCINRRLCRIATINNVMITPADKRQAVILDLVICAGLPILQIISQYIVSTNRYNIYEDLGPFFSMASTPLSFILFYSWPVVIGLVSLFYCVTTIYMFYKRQRQFRQIVTSSQGLGRGRYFRLMALASVEILGTIPLGTYIIVSNSSGLTPWRGWASEHHHYSEVIQIPDIVWKNDQGSVIGLEMFRWSLVACAFVFFAFFGFADEARQHYRLMYASLASHIDFSTFTLCGSSRVAPSVPYVKNTGGISVSVVRTTGDKRRSDSSDSIDAVRSGSISGDSGFDFEVERYSSSNTVASVEGFNESEARMQGHSTLPEGISPAVPRTPPASVPPHYPEKTRSTIRTHTGAHAV